MKVLILSLCLSVVVFCAACTETEAEKKQESDKKREKAHKHPVSVAEVKEGEIARYLFSTGTIEAEEAVDIYPKISGYVEKIYREEGNAVKSGDKLMELRDEEWKLGVEETRLAMEVFAQKKKQGEIAIRSLQNQLEQAVLNIRELEEVVSQMSLSLEQSKKEFSRSSERYNKRLIPEDVYQQAKYTYEKAILDKNTNLVKLHKAKVAKADTELSLERSIIDLESLKLDHRKAQITQQKAQLQLDHATVTAPFDGIISFRDVTRGQLVGPQTKVFSLVNFHKLIVRLNLSEKDLPLLHEGQNVVLQNDNFAKFREQGIVRSISPTVDSASGTVQVLIDIAEKEHLLLRPGIFVQASIEVEMKEKALLVPRSAILHERDRSIVFVVEKDKAYKRPLRTGIRSTDVVEVLSGIEQGEKLVIRGQHLLRDRQLVEVVGNSQ